MSEEWITTNEAAQITGYHVEYIRELIRLGQIRARKFATVWQVDKNSLLKYLDRAKQSEDKRHGPKSDVAS